MSRRQSQNHPTQEFIGRTGNANWIPARYHFSGCLTDLSAWSSSCSSFFFLDLGMILFRADCLSCGVGSLKDTMSSMSSITESHADGMLICQSHRNRTEPEPGYGLVMVDRSEVTVISLLFAYQMSCLCPNCCVS